jgi:hypothetical protein
LPAASGVPEETLNIQRQGVSDADRHGQGDYKNGGEQKKHVRSIFVKMKLSLKKINSISKFALRCKVGTDILNI